MDKKYDVFISYSSKDQKIAEGICGYLESRKYRCFVAYRDIPKGKKWAAIISTAIHSSSMMVVVFSESFNLSEQTDREVEIAAEDKLPILTFRINDTVFTGAKEYYLKNLNWIDAFPEPEKCFGQIYDSVSRLVPKPNENSGGEGKDIPGTSVKPDVLHNLKVKVDVDCIFYIDGEEMAVLNSGKIEKFPLPQGEFELKFVSTENPTVVIEQEFEMPSFDKLLKVMLNDMEVAEEASIIKTNKEENYGDLGDKALFYHNPITHRDDYPKQIHQLIDNMVLVEGGTFLMGIPKEHDKKIGGFYEPYKESLPRHQVTVEPFYIGRFPVTQAEWESIMGYNPSKYKDRKGLSPVNGVIWEDCQKFIKKLNNLTNENFRLPTEAEWEFAARGGNLSHAYLYAGSNDIDAVAWHHRNSNGITHEVGLKLPNELGLYDMSGNVEEWCNDWYDKYPNSHVINPQGPSSGHMGHVLRGGGWMGDFECSVYHRSSTGLRDLDTENWGFRLAKDM